MGDLKKVGNLYDEEMVVPHGLCLVIHRSVIGKMRRLTRKEQSESFIYSIDRGRSGSMKSRSCQGF